MRINMTKAIGSQPRGIVRPSYWQFAVTAVLSLSLLPPVCAEDAKTVPSKSGADAVEIISDSTGTADILLQKLLSDDTTPERAWLAGELNYDDIEEILNGTEITE